MKIAVRMLKQAPTKQKKLDEWIKSIENRTEMNKKKP